MKQNNDTGFIKNFAFFWVGQDITIPKFLVDSINKSYAKDVSIFMITDQHTPNINGVSSLIRSNLNSNIMIARLEAYSKIKTDQQVIFLDADSLVLNKIKLVDSKDQFIVFRRKANFDPINHMYPEWYPEFKNKTFDEMMPFLFGAIITNDPESNKKFEILLNLIKKLPARFHRWYGDQYCLKLAYDNKLIIPKEYNFNDFISIVRDENDLLNITNPIVTFKGNKSKNFIELLFRKMID